MRAVTISNSKELMVAMEKLSRELLIFLSKKTMSVMKKNLNTATNISTESMQDGVDYKVEANETSATIFINYNYIEAYHGRLPQYLNGELVEWGQFRNTFGREVGSTIWQGQPVAFRMAEWLEYGGKGGVGNQPIQANQWFTKTVNDVRANLDKWVKEFYRRKMR